MVCLCRKCGLSFEVPETVSPQTRVEVASLIRYHKAVAAIKCWRDATGATLGDAKALTFHVTLQKGLCHRCGHTLDGGGVTECPHCRSLNLDW